MTPAKNGVSWYAVGDDAVSLQVVVRPNCSRRHLVRIDSRGLVVSLHSPPEKGRANAELIELVAESLGLPRAAVALVRGATGRRKTVRVATDAPEAVIARLTALIGPS
jgi:uncharacterized protein (TIGR00251 family)